MTSETGAQYPLSYRHLFEFDASVAPEIAIPRGGAEARLSICYFTAGRFRGDGLAGVLLPGGGDWAFAENAERLRIDVRGVLETNDGAVIYMQYRGLWRAPSGVLSRVLRNAEPYRHHEHYLRVVAEFETAAANYAWLNGILAVGVGGYAPGGGVHYSFYGVL
jgi:Protein of unknown function (DUF3237)